MELDYNRMRESSALAEDPSHSLRCNYRLISRLSGFLQPWVLSSIQDANSVAAFSRAKRDGFHVVHRASLRFMARTQCTDRVVGSILASWRYDISGIYPEMRKDYENHLTECGHCRGRQKFHRSLDATLAVLTSLAVFFFLFALAVLKHIKPLDHVAFNVFGLDIYDMYHMLFSA